MIGGLGEAQSYRGALLERERMTTSCVALVAPVSGVHVGTCMHSPREDTMPRTPLVQMVFARRFIATGLAVAVASIAACEPNDRAAAPPQSDQPAALDTAAVRAAIDSLRSDYEQAVASGNFDKMATALAVGAVMVPPGGPKWDAMFASSKLPFPPGATIDITPIEVRVLSPDWAYEFGTSTLTYKPAGAATAETMNDTYLVLFRKTAGGWKLFREVASSNLPPAAPTR